jgi:hypothetical protein
LTARCALRALVTGSGAEATRVQKGIAEGRAKATLGGKPTLLLHGREDARVPATFSGRAYAGLNSLRDGANSNLRYIEITHINHFGVFGRLRAVVDAGCHRLRTHRNPEPAAGDRRGSAEAVRLLQNQNLQSTRGSNERAD